MGVLPGRPMQILHDDRGPHLLLAYEEADTARAALSAAGVDFDEPDGAGAGCAGPVWARLDLDPRGVARFGGEDALSRHLARALAEG